MEEEDLSDCVLLLGICNMLWLLHKNRRRRHRSAISPLWQRRRQQGDGHNLIREMRATPNMFFKYTRLNYERFDYLLGLCTPYLQKRNMKTAISPEQRLTLTLRYLATGDDMSTLSFGYRCGFSTASIIIRETLSTIVHVLHRLAVAEPRTKADWKTVAKGFHQRWNLPLCLGAIDGRHMQIRAPKLSGSQFMNYKKTFSIVLMAVVDSAYTFLSVDIGAEGSQNDASILNNSELWKRLQRNELHIPEPEILPNSSTLMDYFFVGDGIFQLQEHLMKPFAVRKLSEEEAIYNYRISRARRIVENAFGILVARWRIFKAPMNCLLETAENIVLAAVCLHNFIMRSGEKNFVDEYNPPNFVDFENIDGTITPGKWRDAVVGDSGALQLLPKIPRKGTLKATAMRKKLVHYLNNEGAVSWQREVVRKGFWGAHITADITEAIAARIAEEKEDEEIEAALQAMVQEDANNSDSD